MNKIKKVLSLCLSVVIVFGQSNTFIFAEGETTVETPIEYIIRYEPNTVISNAGGSGGPGSGGGSVTVEQAFENNLTDASNVTILDEIDDGNVATNTQLISITTPNANGTTGELNNIEGVVYAEPNYKIKALSNDSGFSNQWALNGSSIYGINIDKAWQITKGNNNVTVAVIDTGIDINHPDLSSSIFTNSGETANGKDTDGNGYKDDIHGWDFTTYVNSTQNGDNSVYDGTIVNGENVDKHGTHVAGIIAASINGIGIQGVAPNTKILPVKMLSGEDGTVFTAIKAIEYADRMGAQIANCSWGSNNYSQFLYDTMQNSNMLFVCASGNDGSDVGTLPTYPAAYNSDNIISIGATDVNGNIASFSNYGQGVSVAAPGKNIYSTLPDNNYGYLDGTSMAAPFVSGSAALLLAVSPELTAGEVKSRIISTSNKVSSLNNKVDSQGIINTSNLVLTSVEPVDLTSSRYGAKSIVVNNELYIIGGYDKGQFLSSVEKYNAENKSWSLVTNLPTAVSNCAVIEKDNKIYIIGGINEMPVNSVQIFNVETGAWQNGTSIPKALYASSYSILGDNVYVFGGVSVNGYENSVYKYNIISNTWTTLNDMQFKMAYGSAVNAEGSIYVMGGCNESGCFNGIYRYDEQNDSLSYITKMSVNRKDFSAVYQNNKVFIFGGSNSFNKQSANPILEYNITKGTSIESIIDTIEVFDFNTGICTVADSLKLANAGMSAVNYFGNIYLIGGWNGTYSNSTIKYFGASIPNNISLKTSGTVLTINWSKIIGTTGYNIEIDGNVYNTTANTYTITVDESVEHKIRIQAIKNDEKSLWSEYIFHYLNSSMLDAKNIEVNGTTSDKLYKTGQTRWYKLNNSNAGKITLTLSNVPANCNYLMQLCNSSGEVIATGETSGNGFAISDLVLQQYAYYVKVTSVYGGDTINSYTLNSSFTATIDSNVPDRVRSAFLKPSGLDDLSFNNGEMKELSEYDGEETPPSEITEESWTETAPEIIDGGCGTQPYVEEEILDNVIDNNISLMSLNNYYEETGTLNAVGSTATGNITVPRNSSSYQKYKLVVEVIPEYEYDDMSIEWYGGNTDYENFWWHYTKCDGKYIYYLTANLGRTSSTTYQYKIKYDYKSSSSNGNYTVRKYIICDSTSNEDYNNNYCGNETPLYADYAVPSLNSSVTKIGKIDHSYDRDYYYVTATSNEKISAYLQSPNGKKYDVAIYDNRCTTNNQLATEYMDGWIDDSSAYATIRGNTSSSSTKYCIRVGSYDGTYSPNDTYTLVIYKYNISNLGDLEVNNSFDNADSLKSTVSSTYLGSPTKLAKSINFSIDSPVDVDHYAVDLSAGDKISVKMDLPSNYNDVTEKYRIEIYSDVNQGDKLVTYKSRSYNNPDTAHSKFVAFIPKTSGTYYVAVRSLSGSYNYSKKGTFTIIKTPKVSLDSYENRGDECSNDFAAVTIFGFLGFEFGVKSAVPIQSALNANLDNELDTDWYVFTNGSETKTATISIDGSTAINNSTGVVVLDKEYNILSSGVNGNAYTFFPNEKYYIAVYVKDSSYGQIMSNNAYSISVNLSELRSDLVFNPLDWGTFVYDNDPEFLTDDDMADYDLGNRLLMSADGLSGVVDFQSSHSAKPYMLENGRNISLDVLLYNPTDKPVTVEIERIGYQAPYENSLSWGETDWTTTNWVCLKAWADYMQFDLESDMFIGELKNNYLDYKFKYVHNKLPNGGIYVIEPGTSVWMLGENADLTITKEIWSPFNIVSRLKINDGGQINLGFAAFRNRSKVYSPESSRLIYDVATQRSYPGKYAICSHECGCTDKNKCTHICVKEHDVNGKPKGIASSASETNSKTNWIITDNTEYFMPTLYNYANPNGYTLGGTANDYWVTNFNPNADTWGFNCGVESDILPMYFSDKDDSGNVIRNWTFDNRHTNPLSGNGLISGTAPVSNAMPLGNYGVVERYIIDITNSTNVKKTVTYTMQTGSHAIIIYKDGEKQWNRKIKLGELKGEYESVNSFQNRIIKDIFSFDISPNETKQLVMEVILPNADAGGLRHQLGVN